MKKRIIINGDLKDLLTYCTAIYSMEDDIDLEYLKLIFEGSPIFENKSFDLKVLGTLQKTSVNRSSNFFLKDKVVTLQIRYEIKKVTDIELNEEDENWIKNDVSRLLEHFEALISPLD
ncbi:MAG: hypothetical protein CVV23_08395 [Ignavibacteriae bacterium HGW-Ignavibacteriae-2]|jgi:hypothetical protein|nr:MAG: hypothetical protein CVV23_08395 [Ignavibacteriae bacterium HGW-Ignavibacteriae-2]